jgi:hypothetical protein
MTAAGHVEVRVKRIPTLRQRIHAFESSPSVNSHTCRNLTAKVRETRSHHRQCHFVAVFDLLVRFIASFLLDLQYSNRIGASTFIHICASCRETLSHPDISRAQLNMLYTGKSTSCHTCRIRRLKASAYVNKGTCRSSDSLFSAMRFGHIA